MTDEHSTPTTNHGRAVAAAGRRWSALTKTAAAIGLLAAVLGAGTGSALPAAADSPRPLPLRTPVTATFAAPAMAIAVLQATPEPHGATVFVRTTVPTTVSLSTTQVNPPPPPPSGNFPGSVFASGILTGVFNGPPPAYTTDHTQRLTGLRSNTTYELLATATAQNGQKQTGTIRFTTLKQRVQLTLEAIDIEDDGDGFFSGDGEPRWEIDVNWASGTSHICYPLTCGTYTSHGEGRVIPRDAGGEKYHWFFAEEVNPDLPKVFTMVVKAFEDDPLLYGACVGDCNPTKRATGFVAVPQNVDAGANFVTIRGDDGRGFRSVLTFKAEVFYDAFDHSQF